MARTDQELKEIAMGIYAGKIFTSSQCAPEEFRLVFQVFMFMDGKNHEKMQERLKSGEVAMFFEDISKASPMGINGLPIFYSCQMASKDEVKVINGHYEKIIEFMGPPKGASPKQDASEKEEPKEKVRKGKGPIDIDQSGRP